LPQRLISGRVGFVSLRESNMGWCSATRIFDPICNFVVAKSSAPKKEKIAFLKLIIRKLQEDDWDCESESDFWEHPIVGPLLGNDEVKS
jgi:hypothetical protein